MKIFSIWMFLILGMTNTAAADDKTCSMSYFTRADLNAFKTQQADIRSLSHSVNEALKTSHGLLNKLDHMTLGLVSAMLIGGNNSLEDIQPNEWNKSKISGLLVYQDQPYSVVPLRGTTLTISNKERTYEFNSDSDGTFSIPLYEMVPYSRIRIFPGLIITRGERFAKSLKLPAQLSVKSKICNSTLRLDEIPFDPITLVLSQPKD